MFAKEDLENHCKEAEKRIKISYSFKEPDRIPINISEYGSYWAWMQGVNIRDYYTKPEVALDVQEKGLTWRFENLKDDRANYTFSFDPGPVGEALVFDCPIEYPNNTSPRIVPILKNESDIERLKLLEPQDNPRIKEHLRKFKEWRRVALKKNSIFPVQERVFVSIHPPLSAACAMMSPTTVYTLMGTEPDVIKILFDKMLKAYFKLMDYREKLTGKKIESIGLANDNSAFISNKMYVEQVLSYDKAIYERYGKKGRYLHADGPNDHNFKTFAEDLKLTFMDIGGFSSLETAVKVMKGKVVIHGGLNNKDLYQGLTEETKKKIREAIRVAAPGGGYELAIGGETYPGVSPETLIELVKYVKEIGRYPINVRRNGFSRRD